MSKTRLVGAVTATVISAAVAGTVYAQAQERTTWTISIDNLGDNALLDRCVAYDLVERSLAAPTMPPTLATITLRTGVSRADADAAARCLTEGGATATVTAIES